MWNFRHHQGESVVTTPLPPCRASQEPLYVLENLAWAESSKPGCDLKGPNLEATAIKQAPLSPRNKWDVCLWASRQVSRGLMKTFTETILSSSNSVFPSAIMFERTLSLSLSG